VHLSAALFQPSEDTLLVLAYFFQTWVLLADVLQAAAYFLDVTDEAVQRLKLSDERV